MFPKKICLIISKYDINLFSTCDINTIDYIVPKINKNIIIKFFCKVLKNKNNEIIKKFKNQILYLNSNKVFGSIIRNNCYELYKHLLNKNINNGTFRKTVKYGNYVMIKFLVDTTDLSIYDAYDGKKDDDEDDSDKDDDISLLKIVIERNNNAITKLLLNKISDIKNINMYDLIYNSVRYNSIEITKILLLSDRKMEVDRSILNFAVRKKNSEMVKLLLEDERADPTCFNCDIYNSCF